MAPRRAPKAAAAAALSALGSAVSQQTDEVASRLGLKGKGATIRTGKGSANDLHFNEQDDLYVVYVAMEPARLLVVQNCHEHVRRVVRSGYSADAIGAMPELEVVEMVCSPGEMVVLDGATIRAELSGMMLHTVIQGADTNDSAPTLLRTCAPAFAAKFRVGAHAPA